MAIKSFDYVNYSKVFRDQVPQSNLLLTHLNVFADRQIADSHKVSVDRIQEASIGVDAPLMLFSSEWGTIEKPTAGSYLYELVWRGVTDRLASADLKGYRRPGSTMEQSLDEIEANKFIQMRAKFERSREYAYWQALIFNKVDAFGTQQPEIDWSLEFSLNQRTADLHQDVGDDPMRDIDDQISATKALMGGGLNISVAGFCCVALMLIVLCAITHRSVNYWFTETVWLALMCCSRLMFCRASVPLCWVLFV